MMFSLLDLSGESSNSREPRTTCIVYFVSSFSFCFGCFFALGSIKACKVAALKCDELKFKQYKNMAGPSVTTEIEQHMKNCLEKIKLLEH